MSIASEITRIKNNISDSYDYCAAKGALMPSELLQDSDHLANTINTITELRGQQLTINESSPVGTTAYPTGTYNGITQVTTVFHHCDLVVSPSTSQQEFDIFTIHNTGIIPPEVVNRDGLVGFANVKVGAVTSSIDQNITSSNIKSGVTILGVTGDYTGQANPKSLSITPSTSSQLFTDYQASLGYTGFGPVSVDAVDHTIDNNIQSSNIKSGVTILGVTGNVVEASLGSTVVYPSTTAQRITPSSPYNGYDEISVAAVDYTIDANILAENIKDGVTILGVTGDFTGTVINNDSLSVTPTTSQQTFTTYGSSLGYTGFDPVTVDAVDYTIDSNIQSSNIKYGVSILGITGSLEELNGTTEYVTPTTSQQYIYPTSPYNGFTEIVVDAVDDSIDANIISSNIKDGVTILGVTGDYVPQDNPNPLSITPTTSAQYFSDYSSSLGYTGFGPVSVDAVDYTIDANITAGNIKNGVTILGVTGNYTGGGITPTGTYNINTNGVYNITNYANVDVDVPSGPTAQTPITCTSKTVTLDKAWLKDIALQSNGNDLVIDVTYGVQSQYSQGNIVVEAQDLNDLQWMSGTFDYYLNLNQISPNQARFQIQQQQRQGSYAKINLTASSGSITFNSVNTYYPANYWATVPQV